MSSLPRFFRLRIRSADNTTDALILTSVRGGTNPDLSGVPSSDGQEHDPLSGQARSGAVTGLIADAITSGTDRVLTSQLEDANFRQQYMDRRAFTEWSADGATWSGGTLGGVLVAGYLTSLRLASGAEYEYEVSDATRAEREYVAFTPQTILDTGVKRKETLAEFLARWPNRGCVLGGPIRGGFLNQPDLGGWEMVVDSRNGPTSPHSDTYLKFVAGYVAPDFERTTKPDTAAGGANDQTGNLIAPKFYGHRDTVATFDDASIAPWQDVVVELVGVGFYQPALGEWYFSPFTAQAVSKAWLRNLVKYTVRPGIFIRTAALGTAGVPSAGTKVRVRAFTANPSAISPIYWTGHPVDLLSTLWTEAGVTYSASSLTTVRNTIGADLRLSLRITEPQPLRDFLERAVYGPFGIGVRSNDAGELEAFSARIPYAVAPTTEITTADLWSDDAGAQPEVFNITQATAVKKVIFEHQRLIRTQDSGTTTAIFGGRATITTGKYDATSPDGFVVQDERFERENADVGAVGSKAITYTVPGMVHTKDNFQPNLSDWVNKLALEILDRWGRGIITGEIQGLRGGSTDALKLGDEVLNKHPYLPNHNKRLSDDASVSGRAMQVVAQTWDPRGYRLKLADSGPNAQPFATAPTLTIAASSDHPRTVAEVTITNAATLNAATAGLRLQMAVTTGAAPASTDYTDVGAYAAGSIPTTAIALPAVTAGRAVYVRAAATKVGSRPSTFSSTANVTLSVLPPVTALSVTPSGTDGSLATPTWTPGDATSELDVYLRLTADPASADVRQRSLPPGSSRCVLESLTPGASYTVTVQARDPVSGDVSVGVSAAFTAGGTTATLPAPVYAFGFAGSRDLSTGLPQRDGVFGVAAVAASYPGFLEAAIATETSVGSGTYGSFLTDGRRVPSALGAWTEWSDVAPNDGLRRQIKVRSVGDGLTSSAYTTPVTVLPWTPQALPAYPTNIILSLSVTAPATDANAQTKVVIIATAVDPQGGTPQVALTNLTPNSSIAAGAGGGSYVASGSSWTLNRPGILKGSAVVEFTADSTPLTGFRAAKGYVDIPEQGQQGAPVLALTVKQDGHVETKITGNNDTQSFTYAESTSAMPSDATARAGTAVNGRVLTVTSSATLALGDRYFIKVVPYNSTVGSGGAEGPIAEGSVDRQNQSNTKTVRLGSNAFTHSSGPVAAYNGGYLNPSTSGLGVYTGNPMGIPTGVPITEFRARLYRAAGLGTAQMQVYKVDNDGVLTGPLGGVLSHTTTGWQTLSASVTQTSDGSNYLIEIVLEQGGETSPSDVRLNWAETDYTAIDLSKTGAG